MYKGQIRPITLVVMAMELQLLVANGTMTKTTDLVSRTLTVLRRTHCVVGARSRKVFATTGEAGRNLVR